MTQINPKQFIQTVLINQIGELNVLTMFDQNEKSRCKLFIYNDLSFFSVTPSGFKPETF